jgi:energy-coupling factor transport system permease protein
MSMQAALIDGLRLSAIIVAIGLANSLANPRKLLKSTPSALYEIATALSVAINLAPQLIASLQRVRRARGLRGGSQGLGSLRGLVIPVLEDTIEQSLQLAASMDARGFGRKGSRGRSEVMLARVSGFGAVVLSGIGVYVLLAVAGNSGLGLGLIGAALTLGALTVKLSSLRKTRTKFRREPWLAGNWVIVLLAAAIMGCALTGVFA